MWQSAEETLFWQLYKCKNEGEVDRLIRSRPEVFAAENLASIGWYGWQLRSCREPAIESSRGAGREAHQRNRRRAHAAMLRRADRAQVSQCAKVDSGCGLSLLSYARQLGSCGGAKPSKRGLSRCLQMGYAKNTSDASIIIYDDGEGQHPEDFADTFLSLGRGNKNEIKFVQGVYNMGGCGAITFCGENRYQLVASKRYAGTGKFGFTLIRKHPLDEARRVAI